VASGISISLTETIGNRLSVIGEQMWIKDRVGLPNSIKLSKQGMKAHKT